MVREFAETYASLEDDDFRVLNAIERGMSQNEWVPRNEVPRLARMPEEEAEYRLGRLDGELLERRRDRVEGFRLVAAAYDVLALKALAEAGSVSALGTKIEVGKESDVYECRGEGDRELVAKLHREGYTSFREVDKQREYTADHGHLSWFYTARKAAEKEYKVLEDLYGDVLVPEPVDQNRHVLVLENFDGVELDRADVDRPSLLFDSIVTQMSRSWSRGYVHADMSQYNVMVSDEDLRIIDWPQAVETDHPHADDLLERDLRNLGDYFRRAYPDERYPGVDEAVDEIRS